MRPRLRQSRGRYAYGDELLNDLAVVEDAQNDTDGDVQIDQCAGQVDQCADEGNIGQQPHHETENNACENVNDDGDYQRSNIFLLEEGEGENFLQDIHVSFTSLVGYGIMIACKNGECNN